MKQEVSAEKEDEEELEEKVRGGARGGGELVAGVARACALFPRPPCAPSSSSYTPSFLPQGTRREED